MKQLSQIVSRETILLQNYKKEIKNFLLRFRQKEWYSAKFSIFIKKNEKDLTG